MEDLSDILLSSLLLCNEILQEIDPQYRLSNVILVAALMNSRMFTWRTKEEYDRNPNQAEINNIHGYGDDLIAVNTPTINRRDMIDQIEEIRDDLVASLKSKEYLPPNSQIS